MFICSFCIDYDLCEDCEGKGGIYDFSYFFVKLRYYVSGIGRKNGEMVLMLKNFVYRTVLKEEKNEKKEEKKREKEEKKEKKKEKKLVKVVKKEEKEKREIRRKIRMELR